ncbi:MAG: HEAT repeat domain-containing protein [Acidobacteriia bacterium]|nr:HEAT repeat domain-containing protein [Terriglobia bacterium]
MDMVEKQQDGWIYACSALVKSKDARVLPFFIKLLSRNFFAKEPDGTRKRYGLGSKNGCTEIPFVFGGVIASSLGEIGDKRAMPILKDAAIQGDPEVRRNAYRAMYALGGLSLDELFDMAKKNSDPRVNIADLITSIGWASIHSNPRIAMEIFDRIIAELPNDEYEVASAHFWKVQCLEVLKRYADAMRECEEVLKFPQFENLTWQIRAKEPELRAVVQQMPR